MLKPFSNSLLRFVSPNWVTFYYLWVCLCVRERLFGVINNFYSNIKYLFSFYKNFPVKMSSAPN